MTITRVGATKQYSDNWENIFGGNGRSTSKKRAITASAKSGKKKSPKTKARKPGKKTGRK